MDINALSKEVIGAAMQVHRALGPGLLEGAYEACLAHELAAQELTLIRESRFTAKAPPGAARAAIG